MLHEMISSGLATKEELERILPSTKNKKGTIINAVLPILEELCQDKDDSEKSIASYRKLTNFAYYCDEQNEAEMDALYKLKKMYKENNNSITSEMYDITPGSIYTTILIADAYARATTHKSVQQIKYVAIFSMLTFFGLLLWKWYYHFFFSFFNSTVLTNIKE